MTRSLRTALVAGGSGLVGGVCLRMLLAQPGYGRVLSLGRRELPIRDPLLEQRTVDFGVLNAVDDLPPVNDVYCCLGTTLRRAGSREGFRAVDLGYVRAVAELGLRCGAKQFLLVSALGADPASRFFYCRVKGEAERAVTALGYLGTQIFRPALLIGTRPEFRPAERLAVAAVRAISPLLQGRLRRYRPVAAGQVAAAMVWVALQDAAGRNIFESDVIAGLPGCHLHDGGCLGGSGNGRL